MRDVLSSASGVVLHGNRGGLGVGEVVPDAELLLPHRRLEETGGGPPRVGVVLAERHPLLAKRVHRPAGIGVGGKDEVDADLAVDVEEVGAVVDCVRQVCFGGVVGGGTAEAAGIVVAVGGSLLRPLGGAAIEGGAQDAGRAAAARCGHDGEEECSAVQCSEGYFTFDLRLCRIRIFFVRGRYIYMYS